ncbi:MAG: hypothetical protein J6D29_07125 [Solobacterium sp.]|nr:hypothetical protein [Solobacterium sp.]
MFNIFQNKTYVVGKDIPQQDIKEFYHTYSNINFNAKYQRYYFYVENGQPMFFHETRERPNDYGFLTEEDTTKKGSFALTKEEWDQFYSLIQNGTVEKRKESNETGDAGPWMYLYWTKDQDQYQEYHFPSYEQAKEFEAFCIELSNRQ